MNQTWMMLTTKYARSILSANETREHKMDFREKSFASASESSKLLITLSIGVIAFCVAVINIKDSDATLLTPATYDDKVALACCWILLLLSVATGVWTQLSLTHVLHLGAKNNSNPGVFSKKITVPFVLQIVCFVAGILILVLYSLSRVF